MKTRLYLILSIILFIQPGCIVPKITSETSGPKKGNSIVYGKFSGLPGSLYKAYFDVFDRAHKKHITFSITEGLEPDTVYFAYEIPAGKYELFAYSTFTGGAYNNETKTYYWITILSPENLKKMPLLKEKAAKRELTYEFMETFEHDVLDIPPDQIIYIGDWSNRSLKPQITDNKKETDIEIRKKYPKLMIDAAATILPGTSVKITN